VFEVWLVASITLPPLRMLKLIVEAAKFLAIDRSGQVRIASFLTRLLAPTTINRYQAATTRFHQWLQEASIDDWVSQSEEEQDWILAEYCLSQVDEGETGPQSSRDVISAMQKRFPRRKYLTAWQVVRGWSQMRPPARVPPFPEDIAMAVVVLSEIGEKSGFSLACLLCFVGLLRIHESLRLLRSDLVLGEDTVVLLLGKTKTGEHQRVVISNAAVVDYIRKWLHHHPGQNGDRLCPLS